MASRSAFSFRHAAPSAARSTFSRTCARSEATAIVVVSPDRRKTATVRIRRSDRTEPILAGGAPIDRQMRRRSTWKLVPMGWSATAAQRVMHVATSLREWELAAGTLIQKRVAHRGVTGRRLRQDDEDVGTMRCPKFTLADPTSGRRSRRARPRDRPRHAHLEPTWPLARSHDRHPNQISTPPATDVAASAEPRMGEHVGGGAGGEDA